MERAFFWPCAWQARRSQHGSGCFGGLLHHQQCLRHLQLLGLHVHHVQHCVHLDCCPQKVQALHLHQRWRLHLTVHQQWLMPSSSSSSTSHAACSSATLCALHAGTRCGRRRDELDCEELDVDEFAGQVHKNVVKRFVMVNVHQVSPSQQVLATGVAYTNGYDWLMANSHPFKETNLLN
jgi:hypothetical protein